MHLPGQRSQTRARAGQEGEPASPAGLRRGGRVASESPPASPAGGWAAAPLALGLEQAFPTGNLLVLVFFAIQIRPNP